MKSRDTQAPILLPTQKSGGLQPCRALLTIGMSRPTKRAYKFSSSRDNQAGGITYNTYARYANTDVEPEFQSTAGNEEQRESLALRRINLRENILASQGSELSPVN